jgi:hypothetical protein
MTDETYFLLVVLGLPLALVVIAMLGGFFYRGGYERLLDWRSTRSPSREAEVQLGDIDQVLAAVNRYRRMRGAPERSLQEVTDRSWTSVDRYAGSESENDRSSSPMASNVPMTSR